MIAWLASPLLRFAGIAVAIAITGGGIWLWDRARMNAQYQAGYSAAAEKCQTAQLETRIANLTRDLNAAKRQEAEERDRAATLAERLAAVAQENLDYEKERADAKATVCTADDPAVAHDRRLRRRR